MSQGYDQSASTAWVGLCRFDYLPTEGAEGSSSGADAHLRQDQVFEAPVAVYTASAGQYDLVAGNKLQEQGYRFLGSSYPKPVLTWFQEKGPSKALGDLASQVQAHQPFAMGDMKAVAYKSESGDIVEGAKPEEDPLVITEHPITPLPDQTPIWPPDKREWIDEELKNLLFGQELPPEHQHILKAGEAEVGHADGEGEVSPSLIRTYFIVDAHLRRKFTGFFDLDMQFSKRAPGAPDIEGPNGNIGHIQYRSLFKGEAQEEMKEVAPYLFDMTLPDGAFENKRLVSDFHKKFFKSIWDPETLKRGNGDTHLDTGIFIRTTQDFDTVWRHLRKFTRIQDENGKWLYLRFWDSRIIAKLDPSDIKKLDILTQILGRQGCLAQFISCDKKSAVAISSAVNFLKSERTSIILSQSNLTAYGRYARLKKLERLGLEIKSKFGSSLHKQFDSEFDVNLIKSYESFESHGFSKLEYLSILISWSAIYGLGFEKSDPEGKLENSLSLKTNQQGKFERFKERMLELKVEG